MLLWSRPEQRRFIETVEQLIGIVRSLEMEVAVLRVQIDRLEKVGPKPKKSAAQKAEDAADALPRNMPH
jgi:hypothetical protein